MIKAREWARQSTLPANGGGRIRFLPSIKEMPRESYVSLHTLGDTKEAAPMG